MRNFVAKNDYNRASTHKDEKNDYSRNWSLESELDLYGASEESESKANEKDNYGSYIITVKE